MHALREFKTQRAAGRGRCVYIAVRIYEYAAERAISRGRENRRGRAQRALKNRGTDTGHGIGMRRVH